MTIAISDKFSWVCREFAARWGCDQSVKYGKKRKVTYPMLRSNPKKELSTKISRQKISTSCTSISSRSSVRSMTDAEDGRRGTRDKLIVGPCATRGVGVVIIGEGRAAMGSFEGWWKRDASGRGIGGRGTIVRLGGILWSQSIGAGSVGTVIRSLSRRRDRSRSRRSASRRMSNLGWTLSRTREMKLS